MKRRLVWGVTALVLGAVVFGFFFLHAGSLLEAPSHEPAKAELILALGGDVGGRVDKAAALFRQGFAPKVMLTGLENSHTATRPHYLNWRARFLIDHGVPEEALLFDRLSANTWEEAVNTLRFMQESNMQRVLVVSDPPHLRRLDWVWSKVFAGNGEEYRLIAAPMQSWDAARWWKNEASAQYVLMEYEKLVYYRLVH